VRVLSLAAVIALACASVAACTRAKEDDAIRDAAPASADSAKTSSAELAVDAGSDGARERGELVKIAAVNQVSVADLPAWPESNTGARRLGYLRHGTVIEAYESALINDECKEGWFELANGAGWVCSKYATVDLASPRVRLAPHQPDRDAGMPYKYGVNAADGTPLYRRVLGAEDRKKFEGHVARPVSHDGKEHEEEEKTEEPPEPEAVDAGPIDAGHKEKPKLRELKGRGVLVRKLSHGFIVALDREFKAAGTQWWRTTFGFAVPFDKIVVYQNATKHTGNWFLDNALPQDPQWGVAFVRHASSIKFVLNEDGTKVVSSAELPKRSAVALTGHTTVINGVTYSEAVGGFYVQTSPLVMGKTQPPSDLGADEKWIDVDLTRQTLVAFEGQRPVFATLISSGRRNPQDKEKDFPTPAGSFRIGEKHITTTMDGDVASDGPYSIEDVPWVQYFQGSYALHGAFWHDNFGYVRSHGCVNLSPEDARTLFAWTDPKLPDGWHGVFAQPDKGTRVIIHEDPQPKGR